MKKFAFLLLLTLSKIAVAETFEKECFPQANEIAKFVYQNAVQSTPNGQESHKAVEITAGEVISSKPTGEALYEYTTAGTYFINAGDRPYYKLDMWIRLNESCRIINIRTEEKFIGYKDLP